MSNNASPSPHNLSGGPRATYRVQLHPGFPFSEVARLAGYLRDLGISHLYTSPFLQAAPGSLHGYDVVNYHQVNQELGGEEDLTRLAGALRSHGLGQVVDLVPNHMAITGRENPWWWDVLENGPASRYAAYFDVEWNPPEGRHSNAVIVPVLGDHYGRVVEAGDIQLAYDGSEFTVHYFDHVFPVDPASIGQVLAAALEAASGRADVLPAQGERLDFLANTYGRLIDAAATGPSSARQRSREAAVLHDLLAELADESAGVAAAIHAAIEQINRDPDALDIFLQLQNYRLAFWKISQKELGYRRFFDINTMMGMRVEDELVYLDMHARVLEWLRDGSIQGLRIDHPDGLLDPAGYFRRLREAGPDTWIVIEKILEMEEQIPEDWPVHGTTGYDFLNRVNGLLVDSEAEAPLTALYERFTGQSTDYETLVREMKIFAARELLGSDLERLAALFLQVCERNRRYRDYTLRELRAVIAETAACLPVYRTYARPETGEISETDQAYIHEAVEKARAGRPDLDPILFDFFGDLLLLRVTGETEAGLVERFQQFSGPVMAKGVEDTTFYRYNRFVSLNEVGGNPSRFGFSVAEFHRACAETQERWPLSMLSTSTHDTKRGEDVRARLNVLSEIPERWAEPVEGWAARNDRYRTPVAGADGVKWPDRNAEYLLYQVMVGAWPLDAERARQYMEKASREAKALTTWTAPNEAYESAMGTFIDALFQDAAFLKDLEGFVAGIRSAGWANTLSQTLLKITTPGVPDIYQGSELWNLSLVDPDNRRPVDYDLRRALLAGLSDATPPETVLAEVEKGLPKLWVIRQALGLRGRRPEAFGPQGSYTPLSVDGDRAVAFLRGSDVLVVAPRLVLKHQKDWPRASVTLPEGTWRSLLTGESWEGGRHSLAELLARFPVALLEKSSTGEGSNRD